MPARPKPPRLRAPGPELFEVVARHFRVLGEPVRLELLHTLAEGEQSAAALMERTRLSQAGLSKHMSVLCAAGFARRWREGAYVRYALADERILTLCELMCDRIETATNRTFQVVSAR
jgi:DNA-binding transcriptional ArsR family regulator